MTIDFRPPEERGGAAAPAAPSATGASPATHPKGVVYALYAGAVFFGAAGVWLLLSSPGWLEPGIATYVGAAMLFAAVLDLVMAQVFKRLWARESARPRPRA